MTAAAVVSQVTGDSIAEALGIAPGHRVLAINEKPLRDILDYRFHSADEELTLHVADAAGHESLYIVEKDPGESLGLEFSSAVFDGLATCANCCFFCFVDALPPGMRPSLYWKDDDYRLSFLHGNFVTLTNLQEADWQRIGDMRLSPLYVSVHTTDPKLRQRMLGSKRAYPITEQLERLARLGITVHVQIVLIPGWNDGHILDETLQQLWELHPCTQSVGVVPVGTTRHRRCALPRADAQAAQRLLTQLSRWQATCQETEGKRWVYPADEWYALAQRPYPPAQAYDDFPQLENGVGMASWFLEELFENQKQHRPSPQGNWVILTGELAAPLLQRAAQALSTRQSRVRVLPVSNHLFGPQVGAAGLLAGEDVMQALATCSPGEVGVIPEVMLRDGVFLDDVTLETVEEQSPIPVEVIPPRAGALVRLIGAGGDEA